MPALLLRIATAICAASAPAQTPLSSIGPSVVSYAMPGVLEESLAYHQRVGTIPAGVRATQYAVLSAPADCNLIGREGWLVTESGSILTTLVVDCENAEHNGQMHERRLLADVNDRRFVHQTAVLLLRP